MKLLTQAHCGETCNVISASVQETVRGEKQKCEIPTNLRLEEVTNERTNFASSCRPEGQKVAEYGRAALQPTRYRSLPGYNARSHPNRTPYRGSSVTFARCNGFCSEPAPDCPLALVQR